MPWAENCSSISVIRSVVTSPFQIQNGQVRASAGGAANRCKKASEFQLICAIS